MPQGFWIAVSKPLQRLRLEAELGHVQHQLVAVEEAEHDLLAEERRQHRHAEIQLLGPALVVVTGS